MYQNQLRCSRECYQKVYGTSTKTKLGYNSKSMSSTQLRQLALTVGTLDNASSYQSDECKYTDNKKTWNQDNKPPHFYRKNGKIKW